MSLHDLYVQYRDRIQLLVIYIREAHPVDGWWLGGGITGQLTRITGSRAATDVHDPKTIEERRAVAGRCENALQSGIPTYVDEMDDRISKAYAALPTRLYLVGLDGQVVYAGGLGPWGLKPAELGASIKEYLARLDVAC